MDLESTQVISSIDEEENPVPDATEDVFNELDPTSDSEEQRL